MLKIYRFTPRFLAQKSWEKPSQNRCYKFWISSKIGHFKTTLLRDFYAGLEVKREHGARIDNDLFDRFPE